MRNKVPFYPVDTQEFNCLLCGRLLIEEKQKLKCTACGIGFTVTSVRPELPALDPYKQLTLC